MPLLQVGAGEPAAPAREKNGTARPPGPGGLPSGVKRKIAFLTCKGIPPHFPENGESGLFMGSVSPDHQDHDRRVSVFFWGSFQGNCAGVPD